MKNFFRWPKVVQAERRQDTQLPDIPKLNESVYEFYHPDDGTNPAVEIVFFHGLERGDYRRAYKDTWTTGDGSLYWPQIWLAEQFPKARILSVSYDSSATKGTRQGLLDLYCTAENLFQDLTSSLVKVASQEGCPLVLVGKDLGGLVMKAICLEAKKKGVECFLRNLKGLLYYSTPQLGLSKLPAEFNSALVRKLVWGDNDIVRLNSDFSHLRQENHWVAKAICAANKGGQLPSIQESSVRFDVDNFYTSREDINTICKPWEKKSVSVMYLTELISSFVGSQSECAPATTCAHVNSNYFLPFVDDKYYVPMPDTIMRVRTSLMEGRIVVLHGGPGTGKSSLGRYLSLRFQEELQRHGLGGTSISDQVFSDGVFYLNCGDGAHIISKQQELLQQLGAEDLSEAEIYLRCGQACDSLREELHMKRLSEKLRRNLIRHLSQLRALVVLDDVQDRQVLEQLLVPRVKYLVTTQVSTLWPASDSDSIAMQSVSPKDAFQILGNYAKFDDGVIPVEFQDIADNLIEATSSHPLALATLGTVINCRGKMILRQWQLLKHDLLDLLKAKDYPSVLFGERYPLSVHASMMLAIDTVDDDAKMILYVIAIFDWGIIPDSLVELILKYTHSEGSVESIKVFTCTLEVRNLVRLLQISVGDDWFTAISIHGLLRAFILTTRTEEMKKLTTFLDGDGKFLQTGKRSDHDLAITLCACYGEMGIKQRAVKKMGVHYTWSAFDDFKGVGSALLPMVSLMNKEDEYPNGLVIATAATEVFWKVFEKGALDDANISFLLGLSNCTAWTCRTVAQLSSTFLKTKHEICLPALPLTTVRLLSLFCQGRLPIARCLVLNVISQLCETPENRLPILQSPGCLQELVGLMAEHVTKHLQELALVTLSRLTSCILERFVDTLGEDANNSIQTPVAAPANLTHHHAHQVTIARFPLFLERLVGFLGQDLDHGIQVSALRAVAALSCAPALQVTIAQVPLCLERLAGFLAQGMKQCIQWPAVKAICNLASAPPIQVPIAQVPLCLERLVGLLEQDVEQSFQLRAVMAIRDLACATANRVTIAQVPRCLDRLVSLLAYNVDYSIQVQALKALANLTADPTNQLTIVQVPLCLERLVGLLAQDVEPTNQLVAVGAIANLSFEPANRATIAQVPLCLERLVGLLGQDVEQSTQLWALFAIGNLACAIPNQVTIVQVPSCLEKLVGLLAHNVDRSFTTPALEALGRLTMTPENHVTIAQFPLCLGRLVGLLAPDVEKRNQMLAAGAIANLAATSQVTIAQVPLCLERLVGLLAQDVQQGIQLKALQALRNLSFAHANQVTIAQVPLCLERLVGLLGKDVEQSIQVWAVDAISNLTCAIANRVPIAQVPLCLENLVGLLAEHVGHTIQVSALRALARLTVAPENQVTIMQVPNCVDRLVRFLVQDMDKCSQWPAVEAISNLTGAPTNHVPIMKVPLCLEGLVGLLVQDMERSIQSQVLRGIRNLAFTPANQVTIAQVPLCLERLVGLLVQDVEQGDVLALEAIANLASAPTNQLAIVQVPLCLEKLVSLLAIDVEERIQFPAVQAIANLTRAPANQVTISQVPLCLEMLNSLLVQDVGQSVRDCIEEAIENLRRSGKS